MYSPSNPKYPDVHVELVGQDGNAGSIMGRVAVAMRRAGISSDEVSAYRTEAMSGDYNNLLNVTMSWVNCFLEDDDDFDPNYDDWDDD